MTYPLSPLVELYLDGAWTDITTDGSGNSQVYQRDDIVMRWGRANEEAAPAPSTMTLTLNNRNGKFSPRNPTGAYYGKIGRNTKIRTRLGTKDAALALPGLLESYTSTPDVAALDITGDIDIRLECDHDSWRLGSGELLGIARKYVLTGDQRSWAWWLTEDGELRFRWSPDGTLTNAITITSTAAVPEDSGHIAIRVTLDVNNGAAGNDVKFYTASTTAGPWTQLGATVTTAGVTSIFSSTSDVEIGNTHRADSQGVTTDPFPGSVYDFELLNGIASSAVANANFSDREAGDTTWTDSPGRVWTIHGAAGITDSSVCFAGEVSSWPSRWDISGNDVWVPIEASGIRRRLGQGDALRSAMYRGMTGDNITAPVGYWPCEDGAEATTLGSGIAGHPPLSVSGEVDVAAYSDAPASDAIPTLTTGNLLGSVPGYTASNYWRFIAFVNIPDTISTDTRIFRINTNGSAHQWSLTITTLGQLRLRAYDSDGTEILNSLMGFDILGSTGLIWLYLAQNGSNIDHETGFMASDEETAGIATGTLNSYTKGSVTTFGLGRYLTGDLNGMAVGHVTVLNTSEFWGEIESFARAWAGETSAERVARLCAEEDVPVRLTGDYSRSQVVGPQRIGSLLTLLDETATVDQGILTDDRDALRLLYRSGESLYNQDVALTINYASGQVAGSLEPVEDDSLTRNDVTAERPQGSTARAVLEDGALSVQSPPDGVGRYSDTKTVNVYADGKVQYQADWALHLGTVDEARYPNIGVNLARDTSLSTAARAVYPGDRIKVTNPPAWLPPDTIDQIVQGAVETLNRYKHSIVYNCTPASPWSVAVADDTTLGRADTEDSTTTASFVSGTGTSLSVATNAGPLWTTDAAEFPFDILVSGAVLRVTAISGAASPQTFTISTTVVNGVAKTIPSGSDVRLAQPAIAAL